MKIKHFIILIIACWGAIDVATATTAAQQTIATSTEANIATVQRDNAQLKLRCDSLQRLVQRSNDSLNSRLDSLMTSIATTQNHVDQKIKSTNSALDSSNRHMQRNLDRALLTAIAAFFMLLITALIIYAIINRRLRRNSRAINDINQEKCRLHEQQVELDDRLTQLMEHRLKSHELIEQAALKSNSSEQGPDHSLVTTIVGELTRIEQNLSFMNPATKGVPQLRNRTAAIFSALKNKGYEIPPLVGTQFKEGMNYETVMEEDDDMEPGIMIIKRVTQPCVMYQGKMIQPAKVVVAYNPED